MLRFLTAGESHGPKLLAILEGMPAGLPLAPSDINPDLTRRQRGFGAGPRMKAIERDRVAILGGVLAGKTTGAPIGLSIDNRDHERWRGRAIDPMTVPRPGHADLNGAIKYGYPALRHTLERASARETAARVAVGAICRKLLSAFGIQVGGYVIQIGTVSCELEDLEFEDRIASAERDDLRCPSPSASGRMHDAIRSAMVEKDTLGGVFEVIALGVPAGLGSHVHWDRRMETRLAAALMSIQAIKGVEIGEGFAGAGRRGTQTHDEINLEEDRLTRGSNRAGGIEGGMTTGQPIIARAAMKPISSTLTPRASVDLALGRPAETIYERSDYCSVPRAVVVGESMVCFVLAQALCEKLGGDSLAEMQVRSSELRTATLSDLRLEGNPVMFWDNQHDSL